MEERYYAGFMTKRPAWMRGLQLARRRALALLVDATAIVYIATIVSFCVNVLVDQKMSFELLPWWILLAMAVGVAALWETFAISAGLKLLGLRLVDVSERSLVRRLAARGLRFTIWPLLALPGIGFLFSTEDGRRALHDRLSGLRMADAGDLARDLRPWYRRGWLLATLSIVLMTLFAAALYTKVDIPAIFTGAASTGKWWRALLTPDWSVFMAGGRDLIITIFTALLATAFAVMVAAPLSFLAARNLARGAVGRTLYFLIRAIMSVIRSIEPIVWGIIFIVWVQVGAFPGILALFVHSVADLTKLYAERLESIDQGPVEALRATGAGKLHVILYAIVPQIVNPYLSFTIYRSDINVRMSTVIGLIGVVGIGQRLYQYSNLFKFHKVGMMMLLILATVWIMDYTSGRLRARLG
ncbi:phosphonate ABC transporter, permease protein PhnE [Candidatus Bipolaricaulota bacterium]